MARYTLTSKQIGDLAKGRSVTIKTGRGEHRLVPEHGHDSFLETLDRASKIVGSWPIWKQSALGTLHLPVAGKQQGSPTRRRR